MGATMIFKVVGTSAKTGQIKTIRIRAKNERHADELAREYGFYPHEVERDFAAELAEAVREEADQQEDAERERALAEKAKKDAEEQHRRIAEQEAVEKENRDREARRAAGYAEYDYHMIQVPPTVRVQEGEPIRDVGSTYLSETVRTWAAKGWEFYRVDTIGIRINPGCISWLFGRGAEYVQVYVITFRRPRLT